MKVWHFMSDAILIRKIGGVEDVLDTLLALILDFSSKVVVRKELLLSHSSRLE